MPTTTPHLLATVVDLSYFGLPSSLSVDKEKKNTFLFIIHHERTTRDTCERDGVVDGPDSDGMCSNWPARK